MPVIHSLNHFCEQQECYGNTTLYLKHSSPSRDSFCIGRQRREKKDQPWLKSMSRQGTMSRQLIQTEGWRSTQKQRIHNSNQEDEHQLLRIERMLTIRFIPTRHHPSQLDTIFDSRRTSHTNSDHPNTPNMTKR